MGIIIDKTNMAFDAFKQNRSVEKLLMSLMDIADRSVQCEGHRWILDKAVKNNLYRRYPDLMLSR